MQSSEPFITVSDAVLQYPVGPFVKGSIKANLFRLFGFKEIGTGQLQYIEALKGVSFSVKKGGRLGVIGANGAGKSTLLKAIGGIYPLSSGSIRLRGSIQALFEIGLGFESEATGRENILFRGLVMGCSPDKAKEREEQIVRFADIGKFIDLPIRMYSAGMAVRLAFAISSFLDGDILLIDEVFGAGDAAFQAKAFKRLRELVDTAHIVIMVGHDLSVIEAMTDRTIWLDKGRVVEDGATAAVIKSYLASVS